MTTYKMVSIEGDIVAPFELILPTKTTTEANAMSGSTLQSGSLIFNKTLAKVEVFAGGVWETITSTPR